MSWIEAMYHLRGEARDIDARAQAIAVEQSIEMPPAAVRDPFRTVGRPHTNLPGMTMDQTMPEPDDVI